MTLTDQGRQFYLTVDELQECICIPEHGHGTLGDHADGQKCICHICTCEKGVK